MHARLAWPAGRPPQPPGRAQVFLDPELMKSCAGVDAPPPGSYNLPASVGPQVRTSLVLH